MAKPKPPPARRPPAGGPRAGAGTQRAARVRHLPFGPRAQASAAVGRKRAAIVSVACYEWIRRIKAGHMLDLVVPGKPEHRPVRVRVRRSCFHDHIGDIPACDTRHDPAAINPFAPTWAQVLDMAVTRGHPQLRQHKRDAVAAAGWVVLHFSPAHEP